MRYGSRTTVVVLATICLSAGVAFGRFFPRVLDFVARLTPPQPGDVIPRQIPYRGYLEQNGVPVQGPKAMEFRLLYQDGGVACPSGIVSVPVLNGQFETVFGDSLGNPIPPAAFLQPYLSLQVSVEGTPLGEQRILSQAYAHRAETAAVAAFAESSATTPLILTADTTITVNPVGGAQFNSLQAAWTWTRSRVVRAKLTIQLADGSYDLSGLPLGLELEHPDGVNISIVGNASNPAAVILNSPRGIRLGQARIARINGVRLLGSGGGVGVNVFYGGSLVLGPQIIVAGYDTPIQVEGHGVLWMAGGDISGTGISPCVLASRGSHVQADDVVVRSCTVAFYSDQTSSLYCARCSVSQSGLAFGASQGASLVAGELGAISATATFSAEYGAAMRVYAPSGAPYSYSPSPNVVGNGNAIIIR